jgi:hypothetical protein
MPEPALKRRSLLLMIVLVIVTLGFYYPLWFLWRRRALNALDSPRKLPAWPFVLLLALFVTEFLVGFVAGVIAPGRRLEDVIGPGPTFALLVARLGIGLLVLIQCFRTKDILEDHLAGPEGSQAGMMLSTQIQLSGLMTFLFTIFYLQHVINRDVIPMQHAAT